ncbi:MAG: hypothetical protein BWX50_00029 [Euryarchaeota archaeon ADurb.Bin009]|nr:MAG: hypothetical protein BWX50_00029 [Euryarchaeota archaeon ADurb.Bin009]
MPPLPRRAGTPVRVSPELHRRGAGGAPGARTCVRPLPPGAGPARAVRGARPPCRQGRADRHGRDDDRPVGRVPGVVRRGRRAGDERLPPGRRPAGETRPRRYIRRKRARRGPVHRDDVRDEAGLVPGGTHRPDACDGRDQGGARRPADRRPDPRLQPPGPPGRGLGRGKLPPARRRPEGGVPRDAEPPRGEHGGRPEDVSRTLCRSAVPAGLSEDLPDPGDARLRDRGTLGAGRLPPLHRGGAGRPRGLREVAPPGVRPPPADPAGYPGKVDRRGFAAQQLPAARGGAAPLAGAQMPVHPVPRGREVGCAGRDGAIDHRLPVLRRRGAVHPGRL